VETRPETNPGVGLTTAEANRRLAEVGPNEPAPRGRSSIVRTAVGAVLNPLTLILLVAGVVSAALGEYASAAIVAVVVVVSTAIQLTQSIRSNRAIDQLRAQVALTASVIRDNAWAELPRRDVVPGDVIRLSAGDMVPADARLLDAKDLHVQQAALTGESLPVEKNAAARPAAAPTPDRADLVFFGTSVVSGTGRAVVTATGKRTAFGDIAARLAAAPPETEFDRGARRFGLFITQTVFVMVLFVLLVSIARHRDPFQAVLFAVALAVGLTPELLPMIVTVTLARGAIRMSDRGVVVKHLTAIQNFGSMDVLCTDKTGTLTRGEMTLERATGPAGAELERVFRLAYLNAANETGIKSPLDAAILAWPAPSRLDGYHKLDEVPFDFERRRVSVVLDGPDGPLLVTKGAPESLLDGSTNDGGSERAELLVRTNQWGRDGYRVLAVASKSVPRADRYTAADETGLTVAGFLLFRDPVREDSAAAVRALRRDGVRVVMITGDNDGVARHVAGQIGLTDARVVTGSEIDTLSDSALGVTAEQADVFARVSPAQKMRILVALKHRGHAVGYLGDGINDAPSLHAADVGISVSSAVDVAKAAADVILMRPGLQVLQAGIVEGRQAFGNVTKYLLMGTSSAFGNMVSMALATLFLPFLPMLPVQVLMNNLLYDLAQLPIPTDRVDPGFVRKPRKWDVAAVRRFMLIAGPISSAFDFVTFAGLIWLFRASEPVFQTGWFVESLLTQTLVLLVIRTSGVPWRHLPSRPLAVTVLVIAAAAIVLPYTPAADPLGLEPMPVGFYLFLAGIVVAYLAAVDLAKRWFFRTLLSPSPGLSPG
jgi:Mg2+-importing ATPase